MNIEQINQKVFTELGKEKQLVEYHDIMYKLLGVVVDFINADGQSLKLSKMKHFNPYCALIRSSSTGFANCQACDQLNAHTASLKHKEILYTCHAGLPEIVVPLYDHRNNYIGSMTSGQFHIAGENVADDRFLHSIAVAYRLNPKLVIELYRQSRILTRGQVDGIVEYLKTVGHLIVKTHNKLLFMESVDAPDKIALISKYVEDNYMKKITIQETAKRFFMSPGYLCHWFKKNRGVSFIAFVNIYRISEAEEMLVNTSRDITEIAFLTGFGSVSQFNRTFKNAKGMSPREFRRCSKTSE